jgi:predicted MFS family arabinose efflux permease
VSTQLSPAEAYAAEEKIPRGVVPLLAIACGVIVANIYYAQPLAGPIAHALGLNLGAAGLLVTLTQIGYGLGLLLVVPLGDLIETRRLVLCIVAVSFVGLLLAALSTSVAPFLVASLIIGVSSTAVQILVPYAAHIAPAWRRGHVIGQVMSGLLIGIMLSRPTASLIDDLWGWQAVFYFAAGLMALIGVLLMMLPPRRPTANEHYLALLASMVHLYRNTPLLRRRGFYQALLFGAFSLFWTTSPLFLAGPQFRLSQRGIALFALAGVAGALAAPLAGRLADKGKSRIATGIAMLSVMAGFLLTRILHTGSWPSLALLTAGAIFIDFGVSSSLVIGQRAIYSLGAEHRSRLNGLFMATFFAGGAICSAAGGWAYARGSWNLTSWIGIGLPIAALIYFATEPREAVRPAG